MHFADITVTETITFGASQAFGIRDWISRFGRSKLIRRPVVSKIGRVTSTTIAPSHQLRMHG
jgi:hypothetical protein